MAAFLDIVLFLPTLGGTTDWVVDSAVQGYLTPDAAGAVDGMKYKYRAETSNQGQWEEGEGTYDAGTATLARSTVLYNSAGTTAKINFAEVPQVGIVALKSDLISPDEDNSFSDTQTDQIRKNIDVRGFGPQGMLLSGGADLNTLTKNGFYQGSGLTHAPVAGTGSVWHQYLEDGFAYQRFTVDDFTVWERWLSDDTWTAWRKLTPPDPAIVDLTQPPYNLSLTAPTTDQAGIINQAISDYEGAGATLVIPAFSLPMATVPVIAVASTIEMKRGVTLRGGNGYSGNAMSEDNFTGAVLKWIGGNNGKILELKGVNHAAFYGFKLDGNGKTGMTGIHMWSENDPPQSFNRLGHFTIKNCFKSIVLSDPGNTSYAPVGTDPNNVGRAENDAFIIEDFTVFGDGTTGSTGIHINGTNTAQISFIRQGNLQYIDYGIRIIQNNGTLKMQHLVAGNPSGTSKTFIRYEASLFVPPTLEQCEVEGPWTYAVHDSSIAYDDGMGNRYTQTPHLWLNNAWNAPVLIDGGSLILSQCSSGGSPLAAGFEWVVGGTAQVWSMFDANPLPDEYASPWQTTGSGKVSVLGVRASIPTLQTGNIAAGPAPAYDAFPPGAISSAVHDETYDYDAARIFLGNTANHYIGSTGPFAWMQGVGFAVGSIPTGGSVDVGEIASVKGATTGRYYYGGDLQVHSYRDGGDVRFTLGIGGTLYVNGVAVLVDGGVVGGGGTAAAGTFTTLEATSQLLVPAGSTGTPAIYNASTDTGMMFSPTSGMNLVRSGTIYTAFSPTGFNSYRNGNANVSALGRTDAHGNNAIITQDARQGVDSAGNTTNFVRTDSVAVTVTDGAEEGRIDTRVSIAGTLSIVTQTASTGFNVAVGALRIGGTDAIGSNRHLKLRSYTIATKPAATSAGDLIYLSDGASNKKVAFADGTAWRYPDGTTV